MTTNRKPPTLTIVAGTDWPTAAKDIRRQLTIFTPEEFRDAFHAMGPEDQQFISAKLREMVGKQ
jgi:hypothetical protein